MVSPYEQSYLTPRVRMDSLRLEGVSTSTAAFGMDQLSHMDPIDREDQRPGPGSGPGLGPHEQMHHRLQHK